MNTSQDFDGTPFVAGSLIGLRAFRIEPEGRLSGAVFPIPFEPGENVAHCAAEEWEWFRTRVPNRSLLGLTLTVVSQRLHREILASLDERPSWALFKKRPEPWVHRVAGVRCHCGFYAYTDGANEYAPNGENAVGVPSVEAVIEGYGTCTVGERGFRASKARLVALIDPPVSVMARYPVAVYGTREAALAAHPLTSVDAS